jgi:hypothetical protein
LREHPGYKGASRRIKAAWERAQAAADKLHSEQRQLADILQDSVPEPPELPEAEPDSAVRKSALFDSETRFVTATPADPAQEAGRRGGQRSAINAPDLAIGRLVAESFCQHI